MGSEYKIKPGQPFAIKDHDPEDSSWWQEDKSAAKNELKNLRGKLIKLQQLLYAENKHKLLIILQAMDAGGKDGTIRSIFKGVNPQGVKVASFKAPTPVELAHDYLWRVHTRTPQTGEIVIFNRSHYEDVLIVRVKELAPKKTWEKRYKHIIGFEKLLADEGTTILKFFLNISKDEQKMRFMDRIEKKEKQWKFNPGDIEERKYWEDYMAAFEDAINQTSTGFAPWYVIPANRNWYRDLVIARILVDCLENLKMRYPPPIEDIESFKGILERS
ncbi:MAG TPA: polyphosphate kinase 2 family protein [Pelolinea sp.]|nr:polyphosphate kinase 2 family protein [Pelolinea sp.]